MGTYYVEYDYTAKSSDELTIKKGDIITDAVPSEEGWLKGKCRDVIGHFPENFVTPINKEKAKNRTFTSTIHSENKSDTIRKRPFTNNDPPSQDGTLFQVKAVYTYSPVHDDEISIKPNDIINVTRMVEEGWYEGILDGNCGLFPSNYVTRIHDDKNKTNQHVKQKPVSGLRALVKNEASKKSMPIKARVLYDYKATANDELTLAIDDIVTILDKNLDDEGWWKGELNGRIGVFPDNYVEEISSTTNLKHRPHTPDLSGKQSSTKTKSTNDNNFSNDSRHTIKTISNNDEESHLSRDHYTKVNNPELKEKGNETNKQRPMSAKRPPSSSITTTKKNENGLNRTTSSLDETTRPPSTDIKNEYKIHTPSPPTVQRDPTQLESPRYINRPSSLTNTNTSTLNGSTELLNSLTSDQLQKDFAKLKASVDEMRAKFTDQIQDLIHELDEEKKVRATLQIELERLQKLVQKSSRANS